MNDEQLKQILFGMGEKKVEAPEHRTALRAALLREHARARRPYFTFSTVKEFITMKTTLIPISTCAVLALIVVGTIGITHKSAEAQELVQRSIARAVKLTPEMRAQIETQLKADMMQTLQEAYKAPDLRILTKEEYAKEAQFTISTTTHPGLPNLPGDKPVAVAYTLSKHIEADQVTANAQDVTFTAAAPASAKITSSVGSIRVDSHGAMKEPVKYLRYTDPDGRKVTLGLDEQDVPFFKIEELISSDFQEGPNGAIQIQGKAIKVMNSAPSWDSEESVRGEAGFEVSREAYQE